ncbi:MAG TPA: protein kinase [Streptosporangiaceae bacterium]
MSSSRLVLAGRYRLDSVIAAGGVGEVWRGSDTVLDRHVAIKLLRAEYAEHPETLARFRAEARHAAGVPHAGIAQVYDYGEDGQPFLVMELVTGPSLAAVLARGPLDAARAMDVVAQAATALSAAHSAGLVHRDIKPGNLLIQPDGQLKITDFGIAHAAGSAPLTRTGTLIGTPAYLAPERVAGRPATPASDLYSLGIVCYECLTGATPFTGTSVEIALAHQHGQLPALPAGVPAGVSSLVSSLTAKDPAERPATAAHVASQAASLRDALSSPATPGQAGSADAPGGAATVTLPATLVSGPSWTMAGGSAGSADPDPRGDRPPGRRRLLAVGAGAVVVAVALVGWLIASASAPTPPAGHPAGPTASASAPVGRLAEVSNSALAGQPVDAVRTQLRQLGLHVQVIWQRSDHQQPGTVISVQPTGNLAAGTTVVVIGAIAAHGHGGHDGHGGDGNGGNGGQGD